MRKKFKVGDVVERTSGELAGTCATVIDPETLTRFKRTRKDRKNARYETSMCLVKIQFEDSPLTYLYPKGALKLSENLL